MGFEFKSDQPQQQLVDSKTTLSVNAPVEENLTQITYEEGEEEKLAIQFIEENGLYQKFLLWQGIQEQLKKLREDLAN